MSKKFKKIKLSSLISCLTCGISALIFPSLFFLSKTNNDLSSTKLELQSAQSNVLSARNTRAISKVINLSDVKNIDEIISNGSKVANLDEIYIAPKNNPNDKYFSIKLENNNLVFIVNKTNDDLANNLHLSSREPSSSTILNTNQILIESMKPITNSDNVYENMQKTVEVDSSAAEFIRFRKNANDSYFNLVNTSNTKKTMTINNNINYHVRLLIDNASNADDNLTIYLKSGNSIISPSSSNQADFNYYNNESFTALEGFIGLTSDNKLIWTFAFDSGQGQYTSSLTISSNSNALTEYFPLKANEALNQIPVARANTNSKKTWGDILNIRGNVYNSALFYATKLSFDPDDSTGRIIVRAYQPYSYDSKKVVDNKFYTFSNINYPYSVSTTISGFQCGTTLLTNIVNASTINVLPEKLILNNDYQELYKLIYTQCFGNDNLLSSFDPLTDIKLNINSFNNLNGTIEANLIIKNNYVDSSGNQITTGKEKNFGIININNLAKINATSQNQTTISLKSDSALKNLFPFEAVSKVTEIKNEIFISINLVLNNIPNSNNASRDFALTDIEFSSSNVKVNSKNSIKVENINIKYYFNSTNGSFTNSTYFQIKELIINGFKETKSTSIKNNYVTEYNLQDVSNLYASDYISNGNNLIALKNWTIDYLYNNTDAGDSIITNAANGFSKSNILIRDVQAEDKSGRIKVIFTINLWVDNNGSVVTTLYNDQTIYLEGFLTAKSTALLNNSFVISNVQNMDSRQYQDSEILSFLRNMQTNGGLLNPVATSFNVNTDINFDTSTRVDNSTNGTITFTLKAKNIFDSNANLSTDFINVGKITLSGFKKIVKTTIISPNTHDLSDKYSSINVDNISLTQLKQEIINLFNEGLLLNSWNDDFDPNNDIDLLNEYISRYQIEGEIRIKIYAKNIYGSNLEIIKNYTYVGDIVFTGFLKKISTQINEKTYSIKSLPKDYHNIYATDISEEDGLGNVFNLIKMFSERQNFIVNLPNDFNFYNDISIVSINHNNNGSEVTIMFNLKRTLVDGLISTVQKPGTLKINGFNLLPITSLNGTNVDFNNQQFISIPCNFSQRTLTSTDISNQIKLFGNSLIMNGNNSSLIKTPLITISNNPVDEPLLIDFERASLTLSSDSRIILSNVKISGSYYNNSSIPTNIANNYDSYSIEIYGYGQLDETYTPLIISLSTIAGAIIAAIIIAVISIKVYRKLAKKKRSGDRYEDSVTSSQSI